MRFLPALLITVAAFGQQVKPVEGQASVPQPEVKGSAKTEDKAASQAASPAPSNEEWFTGSIDFGYRWVTDVRGNYPTYRSIVNLGEGPKLTGLDFTITDPKHRLFDRLDVRANSWGGDPYNTAHVEIRKKNLYELNADYRNIAYFNAMPSYANPIAPLGFNERSFDTRRRDGYVDLQLFPGRHLIPYLVFERNSGYGNGVETWVQDSNNEFAVPILLRDSTNNYRGGIRFEYNRWHVTVEEGGTTYKNDDQASFNGVNYGDRTTALLGTKSVLNGLTQNYGVRGSSVYTKVLATANPFRWIDLSGQFLFSQPKTDARYFDIAKGNFALLSSLLLYSGQFNLGSSSASATHTLGTAGVEIRPFRRLRIIDTFSSNRYDDTGIGALTEQLLLSPTLSGPSLIAALNTPQVVNNNREQIEGIFEASSKVSVRVGYRREWGDATVRAGALDQSGPAAFGQLKRNVTLAGVTVRPIQKLSLNLDYENAGTTQDYYRTGLYNYYKVRTRARYQPFATLWFQANFTLLQNQNPAVGVHNEYSSRDNSLAAFWTPNGGKRFSVMAEYNRSAVYSSIGYLLLPFFSPSVSLYRENASTATSTIDVVLPKVAGVAAKLSAGGSLFVSVGSRASRYYQPLGRFSVPVCKHVQWNSEWRWYGFGEQIYQYEGFRAHIFMTGLKVSK